MNLKKGNRRQSFSVAERSLFQPILPKWRSRLIIFLFFIGFVMLFFRSVWVQVINHQFYSNQGEKRYLRTLSLRPSRGQIVDRNGAILAVSLISYEIWATPEKINPAQLSKIAHLLNMPLKTLKQRIDNKRSFVLIQRQVTPEVVEQLDLAKITGLTKIEGSKRYYPEGSSAAHVVGFTNNEDKGQEGIELIANYDLSGIAGKRSSIYNRLGQIVYDKDPIIPATHGKVVQLTIDRRIQQLAFAELKATVEEYEAKAGSIVVLDAKNGEILALANYPSFDPNHRKNLSGSALRNRAVTDIFEPGSTIKPVIVGLALDKGIVYPHTLIDTSPGTYMVSGSVIHDTSDHGIISVEEGLQKSSNIMLVKLTQQLEPQVVWDKYRAYGIGRAPGIAFPGVASGSLRPYETWKPIEQATMAYGYGLSMSLLQLAQMYTAYTHDGQLHPITLIKNNDLLSLKNKPFKQKVTTQKTAMAIKKMLELAIDNEGTGHLAQIKGYRVGGKSGTTRKQIGKNYVKGKYRALFVGMAPMSNPRLIVAVMIDEPSNGPYYGGIVAAPAFAKVMRDALSLMGIPPDKPNIKQNIQLNRI